MKFDHIASTMTDIFKKFLGITMPIVILNSLISMTISVPLLKYGGLKNGFGYTLLEIITFSSHYLLLNFVAGALVSTGTFF